LRVRPVDPRGTTWEADAPSYRVYFWWRPPGAPPSGQGAMAYVSEEFEVDGADVAAVLAWAEATASPDRTYTLYALVDCDGVPGLSGWQVPTRRHRVIRGNCPPSSLGDPPPGGRWQDRPCRAWPADRSLAAEDRSAGGVRDRTGAEPAGTRWVHAEPAGRGLQRAPAVGRGTEEQQVRRPAQLPPGTISGVGPEFESPYPCRHDPRRFSAARFR
jgi:hypothetical protein